MPSVTFILNSVTEQSLETILILHAVTPPG